MSAEPFYRWMLRVICGAVAEAPDDRCPGCDNYGVTDELDPCPEDCESSRRVTSQPAPFVTGPCVHCGKNPAEGYASTWTAEKGEQWYCHPDEGPSCYSGDIA